MIGSFDEHNASRPMSEINVTPLVDVMLVLLVVFIVTAPLLTHSIKVNLPQARAEAAADKPDTIVLALDGHGHLFWNNRRVEHAALARELEQAARSQPPPVLHVRADRDTRYQRIAEVMAEAQRAGLERIGLVTDPARRGKASRTPQTGPTP